MDILRELPAAGRHLLLDGAMGTMLIEAGLMSGAPPEAWNESHPERVAAVHGAYADAGSDVVLTNSFGGSRFRLGLHGLEDRVSELNEAAARVARNAVADAERTVLVAGSMGPTGQLLQPYGELTAEDARSGFAEQAAGLAAGGVDLIWIETMASLDEVAAAVDGARQACDLPVVVTMTFDTGGHTMMGTTPEQAVQALSGLGLAAFGANCGTGPEELEDVVRRISAVAPGVPIVAKANAGVPSLVEGNLVYDAGPNAMADYARRVRLAGAHLIGCCCGSTPAHVQAMAGAL